MCGRYTLTDPAKLADVKWLQLTIEPLELAPRFNIAPTQDVPVILDAAPNKLMLAHWGLIPHWANDPRIGNRMINARAETVAEKPAFRRSLQRQRCLIPADGFFEWQRLGRRKTPYWLTMKSREPFTFAGLWDTWRDAKTKHDVISCTIITTTANAAVAPIHDRMPVILPPDHATRWLSRDLSPEQARALLAPYPAAKMSAVPISTLVNSPANDMPDVLSPASH